MTRILIADDEPLARERLKMLLVGQEGFEVVGECHDGLSTIDAIRRSKPDLVFLDVQMPGANGFEVVSALGEEELPLFVFVTAFDKYALKAFDVHAAVRARSKGNHKDPDHEADQDGHEHQLDTAVLGRGRHPLIIHRGCNASITEQPCLPRIPPEQIARPSGPRHHKSGTV